MTKRLPPKQLHTNRCDTCAREQRVERGEDIGAYPAFYCMDERIPYDGRVFTNYRGCASWKPIKYGDEHE